MSLYANPPLEAPAPPPPPPTEPDIPVENPVWRGVDVALLSIAAIVAIYICLTIAVTVRVAVYSTQHPGEAISRSTIEQLTFNPYVLVWGQGLGYVALVAAMVWLVRGRYKSPFWPSLKWNWPGRQWFAYLVGGVGLAIVVQFALQFLPMPKSLPIQRYFETAEGAYLMAFFGILIAPPVEELFFRGFLYPVLGRAFAEALHRRELARTWASLAFLFAAWGLVVRSLTGVVFLAGAVLPLIIWAVFFLGRMKQLSISAADRIAATLLLVVWGVAMHFATPPLFWVGMSTALAVALLLLVAATRGMGIPAAAFTGTGIGIVLTAAGFALIHGAQLAHSWAPLAVLFTVGLVITGVRAYSKSLSAGLLIHMGYNATLFVLLYLGTDGFRHLERMP